MTDEFNSTAPAETPPAETKPFEPKLFGETGEGGTRFMGGRFDAEGYDPYTPTDLENDPRLAKLANSYAHLEHAHQQITEGKVVVKDALPEEFWETEISFNQDGRIEKKARDQMVAAGIPEQAISMYEAAAGEVRQVRQQDMDNWRGKVNERVDGRYDELKNWVETSGNYTPAELDEINQGLRSKTLRDAVMDKIIADWNASGRAAGTGIRVGDTGAPNVDNQTYPGDYETARAAYAQEYAMADDPDALDAKWQRTLRRLGRA